MTNEHRHFTRIPFDAATTIIHSRTGKKFSAKLVDISFKGILTSKPSDWDGTNGEHYTVHFQLAGDTAEINLAIIAVHTEEKFIGFRIDHMDIDSATHLRRLVELNLGNEDLLERELSELIKL